MRILLAVDGSPVAERAIREVASRPWPAGSTVRVVFVAATWGDHQSFLRRAERELSYVAAELLSTVEHRLTARGLAVETAVLWGQPRNEIVDEAGRWHADLVVLGARSGFGMRRLMGSVALYVANHSPCSVELIRSS